jgi:hypothetical protein
MPKRYEPKPFGDLALTSTEEALAYLMEAERLANEIYHGKPGHAAYQRAGGEAMTLIQLAMSEVFELLEIHSQASEKSRAMREVWERRRAERAGIDSS